MADDEAPGRANETGASDDDRLPDIDISSFAAQFAEGSRDYAPGELPAGQEERRRELHSAAVQWWERGFRVIPVHWIKDDGTCSCDKAECESHGKHPVQDKWQEPSEKAEADGRWWRMVSITEEPVDWKPRANLGILTGAPSGVFVVDIDPQNGGDITWQELVDSHPEEPLPPTLIVRTGGGGRHYYFRWPGHPVINSKPWGKDAGIDIKGDGGQVVAPPSESAKGRYEFVGELIDSSRIAIAPRWILDQLKIDLKRQLGEPVGNIPAVPDRVLTRYVRSAVAQEALAMRNAPRGDRNNTLNACAFKLGTLGAHGILAEEEARMALTEAAMTAGLGQHEIRSTFNSGWRSGLLDPRDLSQVGQLNKGETAPPSLDEFGLGDRLVIYFGDILRWVREWEKWAICIGGVWRPCSDTEPERLAQEVLRMLPDTEASWYSEEALDDEKKQSPLERWWMWYVKQRTRARVGSMVKIARDRPAIRTTADQFDSNGLWVNCRNGVYDAEHDVFIPHDPDQLLTMQAAVSHDPDAFCPGWIEFLNRVQPDPEVRAYLARAVGYSATADMGEQIIFLHHGDGANGKSVFHDVITRILADYAQSVPVETLTQTKVGGTVPTDIARMRGRRYLAASESKEGTRLDEQVIKQLTGGETVAARFMRQDFFEFRPVGKIHLTSNHLQHVSDDAATWRRIHLISWDVVIPPAEREHNLADRLYREEAPGILNWILAGLSDWRQNKLNPPASIITRTEQYRREEDRIERFIDEEIELDADAVRPSMNCYLKVLFPAFRDWCARTGQPTKMSDKTFATKLRKKGFRHDKDRFGVYFPQLVLRMSMPGSSR